MRIGTTPAVRPADTPPLDLDQLLVLEAAYGTAYRSALGVARRGAPQTTRGSWVVETSSGAPSNTRSKSAAHERATVFLKGRP
ncbi:hypothetical protein DMH15_25470 [Streptomyces sp. WAC 06725]|nr:hypothetical protein DMH15_25470 [Streptomyces sp. WAC 06725]